MAHTTPIPPPFPESSALSKHRLDSVTNPIQPISIRTPQPPPHSQQRQVLSHVPGEFSVDLDPASVNAFLISELATPVLDELYYHLWFVARRSGRSIDSLHRQTIKGRVVVATEDAGLHLVWHRDKIYIKPMPLCLLNHDFWDMFLSAPENNNSFKHGTLIAPEPFRTPTFDREAAVGFMRSYSLLVRHHVDFVLARESHLFPVEMDWAKWSEFIACFRKVEDEDVANRYHYGQLRLSRLNWAVRLFRPPSAQTKWFYEIPYWSTGICLERAIAPLLFGFASLSLVLSSMQVLLSVPDESMTLHGFDVHSLVYMRQAVWVFSIIVLLLSGTIWALLCVIPFSALVWQLSWGFKNRNKAIPTIKGPRKQPSGLQV
ncbi:hypothetical protein BS50DRAFT_509736 [Corynespora cassiicola Philippines]|uniref:Uncharacterized protein n=1 Tax=Corynespora cassiicola Philippines TaxID=1448308 RepID=A0A2T2N197_CORCC|nr:hypothetical protein BS50DRAFT_509736 [Corynespora cassiicola Philippines]